MTEEMGLQTFPENRHWRCRRLTFSGRVFHSRAAATGKARSPMVERRVRWPTSDDVDADGILWQASSPVSWYPVQWGLRPHKWKKVIESLSGYRPVQL